MASAEYSVLTPERVSVEYGIAGVGSRGGAVIVDTLVQGIALVVLVMGVAGAAAALDVAPNNVSGVIPGGVYIGLIVLGLFAITSGYFILFEIVWSGQTPGKRLLGLRVIRDSGYPLRPVDAVIRNVVRILDWLPLGYGVGVLVMLLNARSKRLGDFAAGTIVVREGARGPLSMLNGPPREAPRGITLSSADATLVRDFLVRRAGLEPMARAQLAHRLASAVAQRYALGDERDDPERFLEQLTL
jgi:uncharacterized RDD family membrane protein YckC